MAITNATTLADYAAGISTQNATLKVDSGNKRVGIGTTNPKQTLQVGTAVSVYGTTGIVSATSFYGDGANLTGLGNTDFINATQLNVIGVATASSFVGNVTGNASGTAGGLTGTPDITVRNITGVAATFTGVLTYEDVTNVDSVGIVTARGGLEVGAAGVGGTISSGGNVIFAGITTVGTGLTLADDVRAKFGNAGDLSIYHDGSNSYIQEDGTGQIIIRGWAPQIQVGFSPSSGRSTGETAIKAITDGSVELYYDAVKKFSTRSDGAEIHAASGAEAILYFTADAGEDDTDKYRIAAQDGGDLIFQRYTGSAYSSELRVRSAGGVQANYLGSKKFETTGAGTTTTGIATATSFVDSKGGMRDIPLDTNTSSRTLTSADFGKVVATNNTGWVIPNDAAFTAGKVITLLNDHSGDLTIDASALVLLYNTADGSNIKANTLTLGARGIATLYFWSQNACYIQASSLTVS